MSHCYCGNPLSYAECCGPIIAGERAAPTAEALMRARYSAFQANAVEFLGESLHPEHRDDWDRQATERWIRDASWTGLKVVSTEAGGENDDEGWVEFIASYKDKGGPRRHHERSHFQRKEGRWYYVDGATPKVETIRNPNAGVGRNDPCPCGSGKKYKKCCGA